MINIIDPSFTDDCIDSENVDALREALSAKPAYKYPIRLPSGKRLVLTIREHGIAALMEAGNGEPREQKADFSSKTWRRAAIKKLNMAVEGHKFVDDMAGKRPDLSQGELPFSALRSDDFNTIMELGFPGFLAEPKSIKDSADAIRNGALSELSGSGEPDSGSD